MIKRVFNCLILILFGVGLCQAYQFDQVHDADLPNPAVKIVRDKDGHFSDIILRQWFDSVVRNGEKTHYTYQQGYNYEKKQGYIRVLDKNGKVASEEYSIDNNGGTCKEEVLLAFEIFKAHPEIKEQLGGIEEKLLIYGGFNYADQEVEKPCSAESRCVHVFVSTRSVPLVAHAIVKLTDRTIPYPKFAMDSALKDLAIIKAKKHFKNKL